MTTTVVVAKPYLVIAVFVIASLASGNADDSTLPGSRSFDVAGGARVDHVPTRGPHEIAALWRRSTRASGTCPARPGLELDQ